jgi:hypothetical protein
MGPRSSHPAGNLTDRPLSDGKAVFLPTCPKPRAAIVSAGGAITKAGNGHARKLLIEAAWHARHEPAIPVALRQRRQGQPPEIVALGDVAQQRLHRRYWRLVQRRKPTTVAATAVGPRAHGLRVGRPETGAVGIAMSEGHRSTRDRSWSKRVTPMRRTRSDARRQTTPFHDGARSCGFDLRISE